MRAPGFQRKMYEQTIDKFTFKMSDTGEVAVIRNGSIIHRFSLQGIESQKDFDKEISFWYMENAASLL